VGRATLDLILVGWYTGGREWSIRLKTKIVARYNRWCRRPADQRFFITDPVL